MKVNSDSSGTKKTSNHTKKQLALILRWLLAKALFGVRVLGPLLRLLLKPPLSTVVGFIQWAIETLNLFKCYLEADENAEEDTEDLEEESSRIPQNSDEEKPSVEAAAPPGALSQLPQHIEDAEECTDDNDPLIVKAHSPSPEEEKEESAEDNGPAVELPQILIGCDDGDPIDGTDASFEEQPEEATQTRS